MHSVIKTFISHSHEYNLVRCRITWHPFGKSLLSTKYALSLSPFPVAQLYNLSPESERKEFLDKLFDYMQKKG